MDGASALKRPPWILPVIVFSQFTGTSLWFAGNAVLPDLQAAWALPAEARGHVTAAVQAGFIAGTLVFAFFSVADRFSPRLVFFACSMLGALANLVLYAAGDGADMLLALRFLTGVFLAGIYPVGMKIAAGWYRQDLGSALGFLVGALVLGTALPYLIRGAGQALPWQSVLVAVSAISALGGLAMLVFVPDGPYSTGGARFDPRAFRAMFRSRLFRASACGYFGHMWELYAFWAFVPVVLTAYAAHHGTHMAVELWTFAIIAAGALGCGAGGIVSLRAGSAPVAFAQLGASGLCCALSPFFFGAPTAVFLAFLVFWGIVVVGDSPQFSTLNARHAPADRVGSALTIANCIGFSITIVSIQLLNMLATLVDPAWLFVALLPGPALGLAAMAPLMQKVSSRDTG